MRFSILVLLAVWVISDSSLLADWPTYRGNRQRTSFVHQELSATSFHYAWTRSFSAPDASWDRPARASIWQNLSSIEPRVTDDRANVPLIAKDKSGLLHVLITSSTEDRLISLDPVSGEINWSFDTDGPIRFTPETENGIAFFGSDDGLVRAIDLINGKLLWSMRPGPGYPAIVGNGRLINPHPIRTSIVYQDGILIAFAGLFPSQGVYATGINPTDGKIVWRRRMSNSPQGYLLGTESRAYVPTGRAVPFAIDVENGKKLYDLPSPGGTFCMLTEEFFFAGPGNSPEIQLSKTSNRAKMLSYKARHIAAGQGKIWTANGSKIACHDLVSLTEGKPDTLWQISSKSQNGLLVSGNDKSLVLAVAGEHSVDLYDAKSGKITGSLKLNSEFGELVHLAIAEKTSTSPECLVGTTTQGHVICWHAGTNAGAEKKTATSPTTDSSKSTEGINSIPTDGRSRHPQEKIGQAIDLLRSKKGYALIVGNKIDKLLETVLRKTKLHVVGFVSSPETARRIRSRYLQEKIYGDRVAVLSDAKSRSVPITSGLFNLVINHIDSGRNDEELFRLASNPHGVFLGRNSEIKVQAVDQGHGAWRHQYSSPTNLADSKDQKVGNAAAFKLKWFGGVGPSRMPDRHLRGPAPLAAGASMVIQGDGILIGVDPANGTERWQFELPEKSMRYVTPYDGGYACLSKLGEKLTFAANQDLIALNTFSGKTVARKKIENSDYRWGYVANDESLVIASQMKRTAPRIATDRPTQRTFVDSDYRSERPLVCSRQLSALDPSFALRWVRSSRGVIPHGSISIDFSSSRMVFIEGRSESCKNHATDRIPTAQILEDSYLVCLDLQTGRKKWEIPFQWKEAKNVLYLQIVEKGIVVSTSSSVGNRARYHFRKYQLSDGKLDWMFSHDHVKNGLYHGEQVHHPLVLKRSNGESVLVAEPFFYDLSTGKRITPLPDDPEWTMQRPGHSCGTLTGSGDCLFFRANNPTVLNLNQSVESRFTALSPSRPGCWINMIPACGHLLIPEASASCVCQYSLQTSMCFEPIPLDELDSEIRLLPDIQPASD